MLRYRKSLGWTREQLARALVGWVDVETLTALETGEPTLMAQSETWDLVERVWQLLRAQPYIHLAEGQQSDAVRFRAAIDQAASVLDDVRS